LWVRSEQPPKTSPPTPLLQGEGSISPPSLAGKGVGGLGFSTHTIWVWRPNPYKIGVFANIDRKTLFSKKESSAQKSDRS